MFFFLKLLIIWGNFIYLNITNHSMIEKSRYRPTLFFLWVDVSIFKNLQINKYLNTLCELGLNLNDCFFLFSEEYHLMYTNSFD